MKPQRRSDTSEGIEKPGGLTERSSKKVFARPLENPRAKTARERSPLEQERLAPVPPPCLVIDWSIPARVASA